MDRIRTVFLGSPEFAVPALEALSRSSIIDVTLVVSQPDRKAGRGRKLTPPAVRVAADTLGIPVYQPESFRDAHAVQRLRDEKPDVMVVISYGEILSKTVLELPTHGCLNVHPSLLPAYRGSAPIQAAILNGDNDTGVSIIKLVRRMDAGPIVWQDSLPLTGNETTGQLSEALSQVAAQSLPEVLVQWVSGEISARKQDDASATYTRELRKADAQIDWNWSADYIEQFVRAMDPWPEAWTVTGDARVAIGAASVTDEFDSQLGVGAVELHDGSTIVGTGEGIIRLDEVKPAGKRMMSGDEWLRGARNAGSLTFDNPEADQPPIIFTRA